MNRENYVTTLYNTPFITNRADPQVYRHFDGMYYFTASVPEYDRIVLRRANCLKGLAEAEEKNFVETAFVRKTKYSYLGAGAPLSMGEMVHLLRSGRRG